MCVPSAFPTRWIPRWALLSRATCQRDVAHQSLRLFDCDMFYKDAQINVLVRALQGSPTARERIVSWVEKCGACWK